MAKWEDGASGSQHQHQESDPLAETSLALNRAMGDYWAASGWRDTRTAQARLSHALDAHFKAVGEYFSGYPLDEDEGPAHRRPRQDPPPYDGPRGRVERDRLERTREDAERAQARRGKHRPKKRWFQIWRRW